MRRAGASHPAHGRGRSDQPAAQLRLHPAHEHRYHNGAIGAAICMLLTELLIVSAELILVGRRFLSRRRFYGWREPLWPASACWLVGYLARPLGWYVSLPLAGLSFVLLAWVLRIVGPVEKEVLQAGLAKVTAPLRRASTAALDRTMSFATLGPFIGSLLEVLLITVGGAGRFGRPVPGRARGRRLVPAGAAGVRCRAHQPAGGPRPCLQRGRPDRPLRRVAPRSDVPEGSATTWS